MDHLILYADYKTPDMHSHLAAHLLLAEQGKVYCRIGEEKVTGDAVFIASGVSHTIYPQTGQMLVFLFDQTGLCARNLARSWLRHRAYAIPDAGCVRRIRERWETEKDLRELDREIMEVFGLKQNAAMDARIQEVLNTLHTKETITGDTISCLCDTVCLSQSRLSHLFKQETGIPLSRYLALVKMRKGFEYFQEYGSITEAALRAGFDSPSHLAATCKRMFGISFSEFMKSTK